MYNAGSAGWTSHLVATISEWVMAAAFDIYILTLARDMQGLCLESHCNNTVVTENMLEVDAIAQQ